MAFCCRDSGPFVGMDRHFSFALNSSSIDFTSSACSEDVFTHANFARCQFTSGQFRRVLRSAHLDVGARRQERRNLRSLRPNC